jgi:hypothetical protein
LTNFKKYVILLQNDIYGETMKSIKTILLSLMLLFVLCGNVFSANKAISELTASTTVADADLFMISYYNVSVFESRKITFANLRGTLIASSISDSDTTHCPDGNSVYDALALKQNYSSVLAALAGIAITVDGNNITVPGALITTAADGSRKLAVLANTVAISPTATSFEIYPDSDNTWKINQNGTEYTPTLSPTAGQVTLFGTSAARTWTIPDAAVTIPANPIGGTLGATANIIPKANGTGTATLQASGITEDGTKVDVGALNLVTTGTITGAIPIITKSDEGANSITAAQALGSMIWLGHVDAISDLALPDYTVTASTSKAKIGSSVCVMAASAYAHTIHPSSTDKIRTSNGTLNAVGAGVTYTTASTPIGGFTCFLLTDAPVKGTASGATTDTTGYATTTTTITLASAGTGTILIGDVITFAGDTTQYTVTSGDADVSGGGTITFTPGLEVAIETSAHAITVVESAIGIWTQMDMNGTWPIH